MVADGEPVPGLFSRRCSISRAERPVVSVTGDRWRSFLSRFPEWGRFRILGRPRRSLHSFWAMIQSQSGKRTKERDYTFVPISMGRGLFCSLEHSFPHSSPSSHGTVGSTETMASVDGDTSTVSDLLPLFIGTWGRASSLLGRLRPSSTVVCLCLCKEIKKN